MAQFNKNITYENVEFHIKLSDHGYYHVYYFPKEINKSKIGWFTQEEADKYLLMSGDLKLDFVSNNSNNKLNKKVDSVFKKFLDKNYVKVSKLMVGTALRKSIPSYDKLINGK